MSVALASKPAAAVTLKVTSSMTVLVSLPSIGGSFTGTTLMVEIAVFELTVPSFTTTLMMRGVADGFSLVLSNWMARMAAS